MLDTNKRNNPKLRVSVVGVVLGGWLSWSCIRPVAHPFVGLASVLCLISAKAVHKGQDGRLLARAEVVVVRVALVLVELFL